MHFFYVFDMGIGKAQCGNVKNFYVANFLREIKLLGMHSVEKYAKTLSRWKIFRQIK